MNQGSTTSNSQLKEGYKQTEVGVIPEDWQVGTLDKYWSVIDCKHITAKFIRSGIPVASIREVQSRFVNLDSANQTTEIYYKQLIEGGRKPQNGDLILSRNATVGEIAQVADWHPSFAMGQDVCLLRKRSTNFSTSLLQTIIQSWIVLQQLENCMVGSTFRRVNVEQIKNLIIPLPPTKAEQEAIASTLSDIDATLESLDRLLTKKRQIKQGAMQELIRSKDGWTLKTLGESCELVTKGTTPTSIGRSFTTSGINFLKAESINESGTTILSKIAFIDDTTHKILKRSQLMDGDILVSIAGVLGRIGKVDKNIIPANTNQALAIVRLDQLSELNRDYLFYYLRSPMIDKQISDINVQAAQANISLQNVRDFQIDIPPSISEQVEIANILSDMDAEIESIAAKLAKTRQLKQGMMHELLTGRIRLVN